MRATCGHCGKAYTIPGKTGWRRALAYVLTSAMFAWLFSVLGWATLALFGVIEL